MGPKSKERKSFLPRIDVLTLAEQELKETITAQLT